MNSLRKYLLVICLTLLYLIAVPKIVEAQSCSGSTSCWKGKTIYSCDGGSKAGQECTRPADCPGGLCSPYPWCDSADTTSGDCGSPSSCTSSCPAGYCNVGNSCSYNPGPAPTNTPAPGQPTNTPAPPNPTPTCGGPGAG